jgi:hypothetical protein
LEDLGDVQIFEEEEEEEEQFSDDVFTDDEDHAKEKKKVKYYPTKSKAFKRKRKGRLDTTFSSLVRHYAHSCFHGSDIDIFLYALSEDAAEDKIRELTKVFQNNLRKENLLRYGDFEPYKSWRMRNVSEEDTPKENDILVMRTKQAITFHFMYPIRPIQIILRIYKSPAEVLMGFDLDCCCIGYDGSQVWALPRARRAIRTRTNLIDVDRQSTTYEVRLFKYAKRGFRIVSFL